MLDCGRTLTDSFMSFASITLPGTVISVSREDKKILAQFQPEQEHAPTITLHAYGEVGNKLESLIESPAIITGQVKHLLAKNTFSIDVSDCWVSAPFGKPQALVSLCGRFSNKFAESKDDRYTFQVSYPSGLKKDDGNKDYFNWKVTTFGKTAENIQKYFEDGKPIAIPQGSLQWYANGDKLYLSVTARTFGFIGGRND